MARKKKSIAYSGPALDKDPAANKPEPKIEKPPGEKSMLDALDEWLERFNHSGVMTPSIIGEGCYLVSKNFMDDFLKFARDFTATARELTAPEGKSEGEV